MVLKAIDMQVLIPRSHEVSKIQHEQLQHQIIHNHHSEEEMRKNNLIKQTSVNKLDYLINDNIRDNQKRKNKEEDEQKRVFKKETENEEVNISSHLGKFLDIQI
jgi:uncharacterized protein YcbK (DUF882 family)